MATKYKPYPSYKHSGVEWLGDIPTNWQFLRGKNVFVEVNERSITGEETLLSVSEYYGVKPRSDVISEGEFLSRAESLIGYKKCTVDDLAMNIMLAWKRGLGVSQFDGIISPAYSVFRFKEFIYPKFMHFLLRTDEYIDHFKSRSTGVIDSRLRLYPETFADIKILCPSLEEQTQIAAFLDHETSKIDELIAKQQRLIELLEEKRQAVISHAVTKGLNPNAPMRPSGIDWLGDIPAHWEVKNYRFATQIYRGKFSHRPRNDPSLYHNGTFPFIQTGDVAQADKYIKSFKQTLNSKGAAVSELFPAGTLVMAIAANIGDTAILNFEAYAPDSVVGFRPNESVSLEFLRFSLIAALPALEQTSTQSTQANLNVDRIGSVKAAFPPLAEQEKIIQFLDQIANKYKLLDEKAQSAISLLKERRTALISAAVTGKIDVRDWQTQKSNSGRKFEIGETDGA